MRIFDSGSVLMRTYLHLSYALSMTMLALIARQTVDVVYVGFYVVGGFQAGEF